MLKFLFRTGVFWLKEQTVFHRVLRKNLVTAAYEILFESHPPLQTQVN